MSQFTQKEAVFNAVTTVLENAGVSYENGSDVRPLMTKEFRGQVNNILAAGFQAGTIEFKDTPANRTKLSDEKALRSYVSGLQSNWLDKDTRLNGNTKHVTKNPGSRVGASDTQLKAMRALLSTQTTDEARAEIQGYIDQRIAAIQAAKPSKAVSIDVESLPEALRTKYGI